MRIFLSVFLLAYGGAHLYLWWRLVPPLRLEGGTAWAARGAFVLLCLSFPLIHFFCRHENGFLVTAANVFSSMWMGMVIYFVLVTLGYDLLWLLSFGTIPSGRFRTVTVSGIVLAITFYGLMEARRIGVTNLVVRMPNLPSSLEGMRIVQISDVHMGLTVRGAWLEKIVTQVNDLHPDLVVLTGDIVDAEALRMEDMVLPLRRLKGKYGVYAVAGNHEFYVGVEPAQAFLEQAGITVLRDRWVTINSGLQLIGCDDRAAFRNVGQRIPTLERIMQGTDRRKPSILLYHRPITTLEELRLLEINLQLSGHTHGGQLWPLCYLVKKIFPMWCGRYSDGDTTLYVNRGVGTWGPPMRVGARPEIAVITLTSAS